MSTLYLLTNIFPYGDIEPYLENEIEFYDKFDKVYIFSLQIRKSQLGHRRNVGNNISVIPVIKTSNLRYVLNVIPALFDTNLYAELGRLAATKRLSCKNIIQMLVYFSRSHYEKSIIHKAMKNKIEPDSVFYSYRFEYQPYVGILLKKKWKVNSPVVSRAHGYDLYEERHAGNYIPMREYLLEQLTGIYPCSQFGEKYLISKFPQFKNKIHTCYLGCKDHGQETIKNKTSMFEIVSCSSVIEIKRLELIVEAISLLAERNIRWTHYGDGKMLPEIKSLAEEKLTGKAQYCFPGSMDNNLLMNEYANHYYHVFINVSSTEGLPVSIMEAMSFGIPCIATNVGGTSEIVNNGNGFLLSENPSPREVANAIISLIDMDQSEYEQKRCRARMDWEKGFNCERNYDQFTAGLVGIAQNKSMNKM